MEKDSSVRDSNSDGTTTGTSNSRDSQTLSDAEKFQKELMNDEMDIFMEKQRHLKHSIEKLKGNEAMHTHAISVIKDIVFHNRNPDSVFKSRNVPELENFQDIFDDIASNLECGETFLPSPTWQPSTLLSVTGKILSDSTTATEISELPELISSEPRDALHIFDTQYYQSHAKPLKAISEVSEDIHQNFSTLGGILTSGNLSTSPPLRKETLETVAYKDLKHAESQSPDDGLFKTPQSMNKSYLSESASSSGGKGKEAANHKFRYKKKSKSESSPSESSDSQTPVKDSKILLGSPDFKKLVLKSPTAKLSDSSPAEKRKESHPSEKGSDKQRSNESCARVALKLPRDRTADVSQVVKKLKFENEKPSDSSPFSITELLQHREQHVDKNVVMSKFIDQLQVHQVPKENEELILPSTSGLSNVMVSDFSSTDDSISRESSLITVENDSSLDESAVACLENIRDIFLEIISGDVNVESDFKFSADKESTSSEES